jgi:hypothetical protein
MVCRCTQHVSRTALRFVTALPLFYTSLNSSWTAHCVSFQSSFQSASVLLGRCEDYRIDQKTLWLSTFLT